MLDSGPQTIVHRVLRVLLESDPRPRQWERLLPHGPHNGDTFKVVSYNLLSRTLADRSGLYVKNAYVPNPLHWDSQQALLLAEIQALDADVFCAQEVDTTDFRNNFGTAMKGLGYKGVHSTRHASHKHGFAVFYKQQYKVVGEYHVPCPDKEIISGIDHAGLLLVLELVQGGRVRRVCVGTTHVVCSSQRGFKKIAQLMALISRASALMKKDGDMPLILTGDINAYAGSLITEFVVRGSVNLSVKTEDRFAREPLDQTPDVVDPEHRVKVKTFKKETWEMRDLVFPKAHKFPAPVWCTIDPCPRLFNPRELAAPEVPTFVPKVEYLRHIIRTTLDLENGVVTHPVHLSSVYDVCNFPDFIFYGEIMGRRPRLELVARLELPEVLLQLKEGLPAAHLGSDHLAIGAQYRFRKEE
ncbi:unnamed protein product [Mortierella alpina]